MAKKKYCLNCKKATTPTSGHKKKYSEDNGKCSECYQPYPHGVQVFIPRSVLQTLCIMKEELTRQQAHRPESLTGDFNELKRVLDFRDFGELLAFDFTDGDEQ